MKKILITITALTLATSALAGQHFEAATWRNVQTYDVPTLLKQEASLIGKIVAVRFHYRSAKLRNGSWWQKQTCPRSNPSRPISNRWLT
jgi:hypothetical protein